VVPSTWNGAVQRPLVGDTVFYGSLLADRLGGPVEIAQLGDHHSGQPLGGDEAAYPRYFEVHRAGKRYLVSLVDIDGRPYCVDIRPYTGRGPDAVVLRCALPRYHRGVLGVLTRGGLGGRLTLGATVRDIEPGDTEYATVIGAAFPVGAGRLVLAGPDGARPTIDLPAYRR
jgi:hypothetical protein